MISKSKSYFLKWIAKRISLNTNSSKFWLPLIFICTTCQLSFSQINKGTLTFGTEIRLFSKQASLFESEFVNYSESSGLHINANIGYFITENLQVGFVAGRNKVSINAFGQTEQFLFRSDENKTSFFLGPTLGYHVLISKKLYTVLNVGLTHHWLNAEYVYELSELNQGVDARNDNKDFKGLQYQLNTGLEYFITHNWGIRLFFSYENKDALQTEMSGFSLGIGTYAYIGKQISKK